MMVYNGLITNSNMNIVMLIILILSVVGVALTYKSGQWFLFLAIFLLSLFSLLGII